MKGFLTYQTLHTTKRFETPVTQFTTSLLRHPYTYTIHSLDVIHHHINWTPVYPSLYLLMLNLTQVTPTRTLQQTSTTFNWGYQELLSHVTSALLHGPQPCRQEAHFFSFFISMPEIIPPYLQCFIDFDNTVMFSFSAGGFGLGSVKPKA